jgi:cytochrome c-type protein NapB
MNIVRCSLLVMAGVALAGTTTFAQETSWLDEEIGLAGSVFDTPDPVGFDYISIDPEDADSTLPTAFAEAPPLIPHSIEDATPMTLRKNKCLKCHNDQDLWQVVKDADQPSPMPESHYVDLRSEPGVIRKKVIGSRYFCLQCHVPQAEVDLLVENTFQSMMQDHRP